MRICFVSSCKQWGGGEQLLASLIEGIAKSGHDVALVARQGSPMAQWGRDQPLPLVREQPGRGRSPASLWQLRRWLARHGFDVLVLNDPHAITSGGIAAFRTDLLKIGIRHTIFPIHSAWKHNRLLDHVVCVAKAAQQECHIAGIDATKTSVIYAGLKKHPADARNVAKLRKMFEQAPENNSDRHLLAIGSLLPVKGFDTVIRAVAQGTAAGNKWRLWLAGQGPEQGTLQTLASELGIADRVHFLGFRHDIGDLLEAADMLVSASHFEGLSLVLVEAMMAGCPIVATPVGGNREALCVDEQGVSRLAVTFEPSNVGQLVAALKNGLERPTAEQRALRAMQWAETNFSVRQMTEKHLETYERLLLAKNRCGKSEHRRSHAA